MRIKYVLIACFFLSIVSACKDSKKEKDSKANNNSEATEETTAKKAEKVIYQADISPLNAEFIGTETQGTAEFIIVGKVMKVTIDIKGAPANMAHWQHFHGFEDGSLADCATADADKNDDGIVDVVETEEVSGTTMVPFNENPAEMEVGADSYPKTDADGNYHYEVEIPMKNLKAAFADAFGDNGLQLENRVLYIHGVPNDTELPESVSSIADIPGQVTIPIACGKIEKI